MAFALIVETIVDYIAYIYLAAVFVYSNNQSRLMASRARRAAAGRIGEDRKQMIKQPITVHRHLYGKALISGPMTFINVTDNNQYLNVLVTLTAHEVHAIHDVYLNDELLELDNDGNALGKYLGYVVVKKGLGTTAGDADLHAYMISQNPGLWTSAHRQTGCAKLYMRLKFSIDLFPTGIPNLSAVVSGKKLFDPRTSTSIYSNNAALCVRDYHVSERYGIGSGENVTSGTAQAGASNTITLAVGASAIDNYYQYMTIRITDGTGISQEHHITNYVGSTKIATIDSAWHIVPDSTSHYRITNPVEEINDTLIIADADICDEQVASANQANTFIAKQINAPSVNKITTEYGVQVDGNMLGSYRYYVTFTDGSGQTTAGPASEIIQIGNQSIGTTSGIYLINIDIGNNYVTGRKIYRENMLYEGTLEHVGTLNDNTTTTFNDDGSVIGGAPPVVNTTDPIDVIVRDSANPYLSDGDPIELTTTGTLPGGLSTSTTYYYIYVDKFSGKLATSRSNAFAGTAINITNAGSGIHSITRISESRYTCDGTFDTDETPKSILGAMYTSMVGRSVYTNGQWSILLGSYITPTETLNENDLDGPIKLQTLVGKKDLCNGVKGVFVDPANNWQPTDFPPITNSTYTSQDNDERLWRDVQYPFTVSPSMSQRLAKIELEKTRQQITTIWPCKLTAIRFQSGDVVGLTNTRFGWNNKPFEIVDLKIVVRKDSDIPKLGVDITFRETASGIYDWNSGEETVIDLAPNTNLPDPTNIETPSGLILSSGTQHLYLGRDGTVFSRLYVAWSPITDQYILSGGSIEIQYRRADSANGDWEKTSPVQGTETSMYLWDVEDHITYYVRIRSINGIGVRSAWLSGVHTVIGKTAPPSNVTGFKVQRLGDGTRRFTWNVVTDVDVVSGGGYRIKYRNGTGWDWNDLYTMHLGLLISSPHETNQLAAGIYTFGIVAVDSSGNESTTPTLIENTLGNPRLGGSILEFDPVYEGWPGVKVNCWVDEASRLWISDSWTWDDFDTNGITWDTWTNWAMAPYAVATYDHPEIDLGASYTFTILVAVAGTAAMTVEESHSTDGITYTSYALTDQLITARYVKIRITLEIP